MNYPRCALFDDPPSPLTAVQREIHKHGWRPATRGWHRRIWDARYAVLRSVEDAIAEMERIACPTSPGTGEGETE